MSYHTEDEDKMWYSIFAYPKYEAEGGMNDYKGVLIIDNVSYTTLDDRQVLILDYIKSLNLWFEGYGQVVGHYDSQGLCEVANFEIDAYHNGTAYIKNFRWL